MLASYQPEGKELTMKQYRAIFIAIVILTAVFAAVLISRKDVCEIHISSILMEVAAFMDYEPR